MHTRLKAHTSFLKVVSYVRMNGNLFLFKIRLKQSRERNFNLVEIANEMELSPLPLPPPPKKAEKSMFFRNQRLPAK